MRKDVREFIRRLEAAGLTVESTPGHYRVLRDGKPLRKANGMPFMLPFSPDTTRWRRAAIVELRALAPAGRPGERPALPEINRLLGLAHEKSAAHKQGAKRDELLLLAETDGKVVGAVHLRRAPISPIQLAQAVHISHLHVRPGHRRRGIASALLSAATSWAEDTNHDSKADGGR